VGIGTPSLFLDNLLALLGRTYRYGIHNKSGNEMMRMNARRERCSSAEPCMSRYLAHPIKDASFIHTSDILTHFFSLDLPYLPLTYV